MIQAILLVIFFGIDLLAIHYLPELYMWIVMGVSLIIWAGLSGAVCRYQGMKEYERIKYEVTGEGEKPKSAWEEIKEGIKEEENKQREKQIHKIMEKMNYDRDKAIKYLDFKK